MGYLHTNRAEAEQSVLATLFKVSVSVLILLATLIWKIGLESYYLIG